MWKLVLLFLSSPQDILVPVFEDGELLKDYTLQEVRERAKLCSSDIDVMKFLKEDRSNSDE